MASKIESSQKQAPEIPEARRDWIVANFSKGIESESSFAALARARTTESGAQPPPSIYNEMAEADLKHAKAIELIAIRYGYKPLKTTTGGIGQVFDQLRNKVSKMGSDPIDLAAKDLLEKASSIHWYVTWIYTFEKLRDTESIAALKECLQEDQEHRDALQKVLNQLVATAACEQSTT